MNTLFEKELPFPGFRELIQEPLESADPVSFGNIKRLFLDGEPFQNNPFSFLIKKIGGRTFNDYKAKDHWQNIVKHKRDMEEKLGRVIRIQTAAMDYFSIISSMDYHTFLNRTSQEIEPVRTAKFKEEWIDRIYAPTYYIEKLKEEMLRAKRYNHALSIIMLDIDELNKINREHSYELGDRVLALTLKIVGNTIRTVDIIARYSGDRFLIILPNTNKREAFELAERIRKNVFTRTKRIPELPKGITITLSVGQCDSDEKSIDLTKRVEKELQNGKQKKRDAVYCS